MVSLYFINIVTSKTPEHWFIRKVLDWFPVILFAYVVPALITRLSGFDFSAIVLHQWSRDLIMPLAILTVMSALSFRQLKIIGLRPILLFATGSLAIAVSPVILVQVSKILFPSLYHLIVDLQYWKGLVTLTGSWIGGSTSQLVLKEVVACPEPLFLTMLVMDNVLVNLWTLFMFQFIKKSDVGNRWFKIHDQVPDFIPDQVEVSSGQRASIVLTTVVCLSIVLVSYWMTDHFLLKILCLSVAGLWCGSFIEKWDHAFVLKAGGFLIITIMAILGLKLRFDSFSLPVSIVVFSTIWLVIHFMVMTGLAIAMKLHFAWIPIGSMANVGGISTAPAVTAAYNAEWMPYAIILAILSMVTGTTWGLLTIWLFGLFQ